MTPGRALLWGLRQDPAAKMVRPESTDSRPFVVPASGVRRQIPLVHLRAPGPAGRVNGSVAAETQAAGIIGCLSQRLLAGNS